MNFPVFDSQIDKYHYYLDMTHPFIIKNDGENPSIRRQVELGGHPQICRDPVRGYIDVEHMYMDTNI